MLLRLALALLLLVPSVAWGQPPVVPSQGPNTKNQEATAAANTPVVVVIPAAPIARVHLAAITARCSAGSASLTVQDGATTIWSTDAAFVGTVTTTVTWTPKPLASAFGSAMTITLGTCGIGNVGTMAIQAEQF